MNDNSKNCLSIFYYSGSFNDRPLGNASLHRSSTGTGDRALSYNSSHPCRGGNCYPPACEWIWTANRKSMGNEDVSLLTGDSTLHTHRKSRILCATRDYANGCDVSCIAIDYIDLSRNIPTRVWRDEINSNYEPMAHRSSFTSQFLTSGMLASNPTYEEPNSEGDSLGHASMLFS